MSCYPIRTVSPHSVPSIYTATRRIRSLDIASRRPLIATMADTAHSTAAAQNANLKDTRPAGRLLTPELTPGVEDGMIAAELARRAAENRHLAASSTDSARQTTDSPDDETKGLDGEVERIMKCYKDSHAEILAVDPSSSDVDRLAAWRRLGCMTHPHYCQHKKAKDAFKSK